MTWFERNFLNVFCTVLLIGGIVIFPEYLYYYFTGKATYIETQFGFIISMFSLAMSWVLRPRNWWLNNMKPKTV